MNIIFEYNNAESCTQVCTPKGIFFSRESRGSKLENCCPVLALLVNKKDKNGFLRVWYPDGKDDDDSLKISNKKADIEHYFSIPINRVKNN